MKDFLCLFSARPRTVCCLQFPLTSTWHSTDTVPPQRIPSDRAARRRHSQIHKMFDTPSHLHFHGISFGHTFFKYKHVRLHLSSSRYSSKISKILKPIPELLSHFNLYLFNISSTRRISGSQGWAMGPCLCIWTDKKYSSSPPPEDQYTTFRNTDQAKDRRSLQCSALLGWSYLSSPAYQLSGWARILRDEKQT